MLSCQETLYQLYPKGCYVCISVPHFQIWHTLFWLKELANHFQSFFVFIECLWVKVVQCTYMCFYRSSIKVGCLLLLQWKLILFKKEPWQPWFLVNHVYCTWPKKSRLQPCSRHKTATATAVDHFSFTEFYYCGRCSSIGKCIAVDF